MKTLDEIKQLMADGDTAQADKALKELLAQEPDNLQAKMLYGICRQLLGDEATFKRIHDELAPVMEKRKEAVSNADEAKCWESFDKLFRFQNQDALCEKRKPVLMEYVVIIVLIISAIVAGTVIFGDKIKTMIQTMCGLNLPLSNIDKDDSIKTLYGVPKYWHYEHEKYHEHGKFSDTEETK